MKRLSIRQSAETVEQIHNKPGLVWRRSTDRTKSKKTLADGVNVGQTHEQNLAVRVIVWPNNKYSNNYGNQHTPSFKLKLYRSTTTTFKRCLKTVLFNRGFAEYM